MACAAPVYASSIAVAALLACGPRVATPPSTGDSTTGTESPEHGTDGGSPGASAAMTGPAATSAGESGDPDGTTDDVATFGGPGDEGPVSDGHATGILEGGDFISPPDVYCAPPGSKASTVFACDLFAQDCPPGMKCSPAALCDATVWNSTACTELDPNPAQGGEPCTVQDGVTSGIDDCDIGLWCGFVDPDSLQGTCIPLCTGSEDDPICEAETEVCTTTQDGLFSLCLSACDPRVDTCRQGGCLPGSEATPPLDAIGVCAPGG